MLKKWILIIVLVSDSFLKAQTPSAPFPAQAMTPQLKALEQTLANLTSREQALRQRLMVPPAGSPIAAPDTASGSSACKEFQQVQARLSNIEKIVLEIKEQNKPWWKFW